MKIIVLSVTKYKEKDAIVNAISEEEFLTFNARGVLSPTSKNAVINNPLAIVDVVLTKGKTNQYNLNESSLIEVPFNINNDINYMVAMNLIAEATLKMLEDEEKHLAYKYLEKAIYALKKYKHPMMVATSYLTKLINLAGYSLEINRCVSCGSKQNIVTFSFIDGGYLCKDCVSEDTPNDLTKDQLLLIRTLCGSQDFDFRDVSYTEDSIRILLAKFISFINDIGGVELRSQELIFN